MVTLTYLLSESNPVFSAYVFYSIILVMKMFTMSLLTGRQRFIKKVFANSEDITLMHEANVKYNDADVERTRRGHQNDLESIPPFLFVGFLYILTSPSELIAVNLFRIFTICRIIHTIVYTVVVIHQPARLLSFSIPMFITMYIAIQVAWAFS